MSFRLCECVCVFVHFTPFLSSFFSLFYAFEFEHHCPFSISTLLIWCFSSCEVQASKTIWCLSFRLATIVVCVYANWHHANNYKSLENYRNPFVLIENSLPPRDKRKRAWWKDSNISMPQKDYIYIYWRVLLGSITAIRQWTRIHIHALFVQYWSKWINDGNQTNGKLTIYEMNSKTNFQ